ncbi:hypothetical protein BOTBODRAFT_362498 [Botryobasidium botryosum FD-172 SS1]|uniref:Protein kinase domain-containing protein n=1 Tax=Botryobasidium botryosum (strain FD-172 SS1) TaxID=930990 RepID=A0A067MDP2_BOTB1|nr:hypothetical protein BOTBODRAFT_362498 [Botryobasidium botryosum FD-172 SS1]
MSAFIEKKGGELDSALEAFNMSSHLRLQRIIDEVCQSLGSGDSFNAMLNDYAKNQDALFVIMGELQKRNRQQTSGSADQAKTRERILEVQSILGGGLPDVNLGRAECQTVGDTLGVMAENQDVYEGMWMGRQMVALRVFRDIGRINRRRLARQVTIWSQLRHERIVTLYGVYTVGRSFPYGYLVTPWYPDNAVEYVKWRSPAIVLRLCYQVACGLQYPHNLPRPVVHGNLRGSSILISSNENAVLSDFGLPVATTDFRSIATENMRWTPAEAQRGQRSPDVDTWAWAMTTLELLTLKLPFHGIPLEDALTMINAGVRPKRESYRIVVGYLDDSLWSILQACWREPRERLSAGEIVEQLECYACEHMIEL